MIGQGNLDATHDRVIAAATLRAVLAAFTPLGTGLLLAASALLLHCGARTGLVGPTGDASPSDDAAAPGDAAIPEAAPCQTAPPGGTAISFPQETIAMSVAVAANTIYGGTTAISSSSPLYVGTIASVPATGGSLQALSAPQYNFGTLVTDGARLYYTPSSGVPTGPNGARYTILGVAAIDLATGTYHSITTSAPPWSTSSQLDSTMIAATTAWAGVFWIGGTTGSDAASTLSAWDAQSDTVTTIATGESLSGVAVDDTRVYWADVGTGAGITVYSAPLGGGAADTIASVPGGTHGVLLGVSDADVVFVTDYATGTIDAVSRTGGTPRLLVTAAAAWVNAFAWVDDTDLYWTEDVTPTTLKRVPVAGGTPAVVPTQGKIQSLAFDACNVYVGSWGPTQVVVMPR